MFVGPPFFRRPVRPGKRELGEESAQAGPIRNCEDDREWDLQLNIAFASPSLPRRPEHPGCVRCTGGAHQQTQRRLQYATRND